MVDDGGQQCVAMVKRCGSSLTLSRQPTLSAGWRHGVGVCDHRERGRRGAIQCAGVKWLLRHGAKFS